MRPNTTPTDQQLLLLNGCPVIQLHRYRGESSDTIFLKDNMLVFLLTGSFSLCHGRLQYTILQNQFAFLKKEILVEYSAMDATCIAVSLNDSLVKEFARTNELPAIPATETAAITLHAKENRLNHYLDSLIWYFDMPDKAGENLIKLKLLELLCYLEKHYGSIMDRLLDLKEHFRNDITSIIEENIMNPLSLSQLARLTGRSLSSFRRDFMAIYNMSPSKWIRQKRLEKARELLQCTNMTVTDICYTLGYENIAHFSRLFKSHFRDSPSAYRNGLLMAS